MKLRTDFVTNSSSSAFIFEQGLDYKKLFSGEALQWLEKWKKRISEQDIEFLDNMFRWFGQYEYLEKCKTEEQKEFRYLFWVLAYSMECDYYYENWKYLSSPEDGIIDYDKVKEAIQTRRFPDLSHMEDDFGQSRDVEFYAKLETLWREQPEALLAYVEILQKENASVGELLERFFEGRESVCTSSYDPPCDFLYDAWGLDEEIRWQTYHR